MCRSCHCALARSKRYSEATQPPPAHTSASSGTLPRTADRSQQCTTLPIERTATTHSCRLQLRTAAVNLQSLPNLPLPTSSRRSTAMSRTFLLSLFLALSLTFSLSVAQPEMPSPPSPGDMYEDAIFEIAQFGGGFGGGATQFGLGYGGGGKAAFPVGAFGANVGLPAVPAVPLAIAGGGGKGKHGGGGYGGGGGGHGKKGGRGPRLGFLIAAPVPVAQPYGGRPQRAQSTTCTLALHCSRALTPLLSVCCGVRALLSACQHPVSEEGRSEQRSRIRIRRQRILTTNHSHQSVSGVLDLVSGGNESREERVGGH